MLIYQNSWVTQKTILWWHAGPPRRGEAGGTMTPGAIDFRGPMGFRKAVGFSGPSRGPMSSRGAHRKDTENSACEAWRPFFFILLEITKFRPEKPSKFRWKPFFVFGDHIIIRTKLRHFLRLFWSSQNRKSVIFELAPGPRSALGARGSKCRKVSIRFNQFANVLIILKHAREKRKKYHGKVMKKIIERS